MIGNNFWAKPDGDVHIAYESSSYLVVVTPKGWRDQARADTDRNLCEYAVVNKDYGCIEASSNNVTAAIMMAKSFQEQYNEMKKEDVSNVRTLGFLPKDRTE